MPTIRLSDLLFLPLKHECYSSSARGYRTRFTSQGTAMNSNTNLNASDCTRTFECIDTRLFVKNGRAIAVFQEHLDCLAVADRLNRECKNLNLDANSTDHEYRTIVDS